MYTFLSKQFMHSSYVYSVYTKQLIEIQLNWGQHQCVKELYTNIITDSSTYAWDV